MEARAVWIGLAALSSAVLFSLVAFPPVSHATRLSCDGGTPCRTIPPSNGVAAGLLGGN